MSSAIKLAEAPEETKTIINEYPAPQIVCDQAMLKDWAAERARFDKDPDQFWGEIAKQFVWSKPWNKVFEWDGIHHKWFLGGRTNITVNALDRHANSANRNKVAFIWLAEDGSERVVTYGQLYR